MKSTRTILMISLTLVIGIIIGIISGIQLPPEAIDPIPNCKDSMLCEEPPRLGNTDLYFDEESIGHYTSNDHLYLKYKFRVKDGGHPSGSPNSAADAIITTEVPGDISILNAYISQYDTRRPQLNFERHECIICENYAICDPINNLNFERNLEGVEDTCYYLIELETQLPRYDLSTCEFNISSCVENTDVNLTNNDYRLELCRMFVVISDEEGPEVLPQDIPDICKELNIIEDCFGGIEPYGRNNRQVYVDYKNKIEEIEKVELFKKDKLIKQLILTEGNTILTIPIKDNDLSDLNIRYTHLK